MHKRYCTFFDYYQKDALQFLKTSEEVYDLVFLDLSSLKDNDKLLHLYSKEFYSIIFSHLKKNGNIVMWAYRDFEHQQVLKESFFVSGARYYSNFCAQYQENEKLDDSICIQNFFVFSQEKNTKILRSQNSEYQNLVYAIIPDMQTLRSTGKSPNSIFRPNYGIISRKARN